MGQKVNPIIFRLGPIHNWSSRWFSKKDYAVFLKQDIRVKKFIKKSLKEASVVKIEIEIKEKFLDPKTSLNLNIQEVKTPNLSAELLVQGMVADLEKRIAFRRIMKQTIGKAEKAGAKGVKVLCSGRLNGAEIARRETLTRGSLPLHTIRADIDYSRGVANTTYGTIGVKVWVYKGEKFNKESK